MTKTEFAAAADKFKSFPMFDNSEKEYTEIILPEYQKIATEIGITEGYKDFAFYNAKISMEISKIRAARAESLN